MSRLVWSDTEYVFGVDRGVVYPKDSAPMVWNGIISIDEIDEDQSATAVFVDGVKYFRGNHSGVLKLKIEAVDYPVLQVKDFGFSYRTMVKDGHIIHMVYNAMISNEVEIQHNTIGPNDISSIVFDVYTKPELNPMVNPYTHIMVDSRYTSDEVIDQIENMLYGTASTVPELPSLSVLIDIFDPLATLVITDNGDGTWTATGPNELFTTVNATTFIINAPALDYLNDTTYRIRSW